MEEAYQPSDVLVSLSLQDDLSGILFTMKKKVNSISLISQFSTATNLNGGK